MKKLFIVTMYADPETLETRYGFGVSDVEAFCLETISVFGKTVFFFGAVNYVTELFNTTQEGDGWPADTKLFFEIVLGNEENFSYWHSLRYDGDIPSLVVSVRNPGEDPADAKVFDMAQDLDTGGSWFGLFPDAEGRRKILRFTFDAAEDTYRQIKNLQVFYQNKQRII